MKSFVKKTAIYYCYTRGFFINQETFTVSDDLVLEDYQRFYNFVKTVILPFEPESHKQHAPFHLSLMLTACEVMSATAAARGSLKSTILARYRALYRLVDPTPGTTPISKLEILIISNTAKLSRQHLAWIKSNLTSNPHLLARYGDMTDVNNLKWNEDEIELVNGNTCYALGYDSQIRGRHPTDVFVDDLESKSNTKTPEALDTLRDWFYTDLFGMKLPETRLTVIGTILGKDSLLAELVRKVEFKGRIWRALNEATDLDYKRIPSLIKDGLVSLWPQRWPVEYLQNLKATMGTHKFNAEYQNMPVGLEDPIIMDEWIKRHPVSDLSKIVPVRRYMAVDPAFTEEKWGCYSAIIVLDEAADGRLYERLSWRKKVAAPELISTIMNFYIQFRSECPNIMLGIEEVAAQKAIRQMIREKDPNLAAQIIPLRPDIDKTRRLIDVSRFFEMGIVSLSTESFIEEILNAPKGDMDRVDACVYCLKMYEMQHPIHLDNSSVILDPLKNLGQNESELYIQNALKGLPGYEVKAEQKRNYFEAMRIAQFFDSL